jgi:hypothetical protein
MGWLSLMLALDQGSDCQEESREEFGTFATGYATDFGTS